MTRSALAGRADHPTSTARPSTRRGAAQGPARGRPPSGKTIALAGSAGSLLAGRWAPFDAHWFARALPAARREDLGRMAARLDARAVEARRELAVLAELEAGVAGAAPPALAGRAPRAAHRRRSSAQAAAGGWLHAARGTGALRPAQPATADPWPCAIQHSSLSAVRRAAAPTALRCRGRPGAAGAAAAGGPGGGRAARAQPAGRPRGGRLGGRAVLSARVWGSARLGARASGALRGCPASAQGAAEGPRHAKRG